LKQIEARAIEVLDILLLSFSTLSDLTKRLAERNSNIEEMRSA
jgi:hypothetical protein